MQSHTVSPSSQVMSLKPNAGISDQPHAVGYLFTIATVTNRLVTPESPSSSSWRVGEGCIFFFLLGFQGSKCMFLRQAAWTLGILYLFYAGSGFMWMLKASTTGQPSVFSQSTLTTLPNCTSIKLSKANKIKRG